MHLFSALKKIFAIKKSKSFYNSNFILNVKEKQSILIAIFIIVFPILIGTIIVSIN